MSFTDFANWYSAKYNINPSDSLAKLHKIRENSPKLYEFLVNEFQASRNKVKPVMKMSSQVNIAKGYDDLEKSYFSGMQMVTDMDSPNNIPDDEDEKNMLHFSYRPGRATSRMAFRSNIPSKEEDDEEPQPYRATSRMAFRSNVPYKE